jgi:transposase
LGSFGTAVIVTHDRTVARLPIACAREVTVAKIICGVDVSSETLDASIGADGPHVQVSRDGEGVNALARFCREHKASLVVMEASGGYEQLVFALLWKKKVACAIVNARAVRWFAESMGKLEKTDRIDAGMIAEYAAAKPSWRNSQPARRSSGSAPW